MDASEQVVPADEGRLERRVGRPVPERANSPCPYADLCDQEGDCASGCAIRGAARGCPECAWGKVLGCWRCGGR
jgi:hypothetical protein